MIERLKRNEQVKIRQQTAEDFHDDIGNKLTRIVILSDMLEKKSKNEKKLPMDIINQIRENAATLFTGTKDILWALDPQSDNLLEIYNYVKNFAIDTFDNTDISLSFGEFDVAYNNLLLPLEFSRNISMIFKELINNILKHSKATCVYIKVSVNNNNIDFYVKDDGVGFNKEIAHNGRGLKNIRTRAHRINGRITISSVEGEGCEVVLSFRLN